MQIRNYFSWLVFIAALVPLVIFIPYWGVMTVMSPMAFEAPHPVAISVVLALILFWSYPVWFWTGVLLAVKNLKIGRHVQALLWLIVPLAYVGFLSYKLDGGPFGMLLRTG